MKRKKIITALTLTMVIGMGATAYAAAANPASAPVQRLGLGRITSMRGYDYISNILKDKLGVTDADIKSAVSSGKTPYELAAEKGMTEDQIKTAMLEEKTQAVDEAVNKGTITKEEGETLKAKLKTNIANCTGNFGRVRGYGQGRGLGRGMMGNGQCRFGN